MDVHGKFTLPKPDDSILPLIQRAGFGQIASIGHFKIQPSLVAAMIERWRPETHTFHLPVGECTITLQDAQLQLGLSVDGNVITGDTSQNWPAVCERYLGKVVPSNAKDGNCILLTWLRREFMEVPQGASTRVLKQYCRAWLLLLIGGYILPDKTSNRVSMKYLLLLTNWDEISKYSWGSACLTNLYRMLCKTSTRNANAMGGCTLLLQSWVWYRMPFLAPSCNRSYDWPLAKRWVTKPLNHTRCPRDILSYRTIIDHMRPEDFKWLAYEHFELPAEAYEGSAIWTTNTAMVCFHMVEWHQVDRVKLQFRLLQDIPAAPRDLTCLHAITMQGQHDVDWARYHSDWIDYWNDRESRCVVGQPCYGTPKHSDRYMHWFFQNSRPYLSIEQQLRDPRAAGVVLADVDEDEDEEQVPPPPTTQTERRERNRNRYRRPAQTEENNPSFPQNEEYVPHRHSISHTPTSQHYQSVEDTYRHSTADSDRDMWQNMFGFGAGTLESAIYARRLEEMAGGASSSSVPQFFPYPPAPQPDGPNFSSVPDFFPYPPAHQPDGASSSSVPQFFPDPPPPAPTEEEPEQPQRRQNPQRQRRPRRCGTGSHLFR